MSQEQIEARQRRDYYEALIRQKEAELRHARGELRKAQRALAQTIAADPEAYQPENRKEDT